MAGVAVSSMDEKLEAPTTKPGDLAECKLKHLRNRWGVVDAHWHKAPQIVYVDCMGVRETWEHWGHERGEDATYHLTAREKL